MAKIKTDIGIYFLCSYFFDIYLKFHAENLFIQNAQIRCFPEAYGNLLNFKHVQTFNQELHTKELTLARGLNEM